MIRFVCFQLKAKKKKKLKFVRISNNALFTLPAANQKFLNYEHFFKKSFHLPALHFIHLKKLGLHKVIFFIKSLLFKLWDKKQEFINNVHFCFPKSFQSVFKEEICDFKI